MSIFNFSSTQSIAIPLSGAIGASNPYPSSINVSGLVGNLTKLTVTLNNLTHTYSRDIDILLIGPTGAKILLMSDVGGSSSLSNLTFTFDASATGFLPETGQPTSGIYKPTDFTDVNGADTFANSPAPTGPYGVDLSVFNNTSPNGTWRLYVVDDGVGDSGSLAGGWSIAVSMPNQPPVIAGGNAVNFAENGAGTVYATVASDPDAGTVLAYSLTGTDAGLFNISNSGVVTFKNAPNFEVPTDNGGNNVYDFVVNASDGSLTATKAVAVTVTNVNEAPVLTGTQATLGDGTEDIAYTINVADLLTGFTDVEGDTLSVANLTATNGTLTNNNNGTYTFNPTANYNGVVNLSYNVIDGKGGTVAASRSFSLVAVNDAPVLTGTQATLGDGTEDIAYTVNVSNLLQGFTDVDGDTLSVANLTATNGTLTNNNNGTYTFNPTANYNGVVNLSYNVIDGKGGTVAASRSFSLVAVNDAPVLTGTQATLGNGTEDIAYTVNVSNLLQGFTDVDGDTLSVANLTATNGTLTNNNNGSYTFNPTANYNGLVNLSYNVIDGQGGAVAATNSFNLTAVNDLPTVTNATQSLTGGTTLTLPNTVFTSNYSDLETPYIVKVKITTLPSNGVLALNNVAITQNQEILAADLAQLTYKPTADFSGTNTFTWQGSDGTDYSTNSATVTLTVTAPVATNIFEVTQATDNGLGDTVGSLSWAIKQANNTVGLDTIKLTTDVRLAFDSSVTRMKTLINSDMIIDGYEPNYGSHLISGDRNNNGLVDAADRPIFFVYGGEEAYLDYDPAVFSDKGSNGIVDVSFKDLTLYGGVAQGDISAAGMGNGGNGGDGGFGGAGGSNGDAGENWPGMSSYPLTDDNGNIVLDDNGQVIFVYPDLDAGGVSGLQGKAGFGATEASGYLGAGMGGAIFIRTGTLNITNSSFTANGAKGGRGVDQDYLVSAKGYGGAIFAMTQDAIDAQNLINAQGMPTKPALVNIDSATTFTANIASSSLVNPNLALTQTFMGTNLNTNAVWGTTAKTAAGKGMDGPIAGGTVFFDANLNGLQDAVEPFTTTDSTGNYVLVISNEFDTNGNGTINPSEGVYVLVGGTDAITGQTFTGTLKATPGSTVITPLTSLINALVNTGLTAAQAETQIETALGLPSGIDLSTFDPVEAAQTGSADGQKILAAQVAVQTLITQLSQSIQTVSPGLGTNTIGDAVGKALTNAIQSGSLDLSNTTQVESLLNSTVNTLTTNDNTLNLQTITDNASQLAQVAAASSEQILTATDASELFQAQTVAQGSTTSDLKSALNAPQTFANVVTNNTGTNLDNKVAAATINVLPVAVGDTFSTDEDISITTGNLLTNDSTIGNGTLTLSAVNGVTSDVGQALTLESGAILTVNANGTFSYNPNQKFDYLKVGESKTETFSYSLTSGTSTDIATVTLTINGVNDAPIIGSSIISNPNISVLENTTGTFLFITATDPEGSTLSYGLTGTDANLFNVDGVTGGVSFKTVPNFENAIDSGVNNVYDINVTASDGSLTTSQALAITVTNINEAPTAVNLNNQITAIAENTSTATRIKVADIAITDDALGTGAIALTGTDAASFEADATGLYIKAGISLNFEAKSSYAVTVEVNDPTVGSAIDATTNFALTVTNVNEAATNVTLSNNAIAENVAAGTAIGVFNVTDVDSTSFAYSLVSGTGGNDNSAFTIDNGTLKINVSPDFETKPSYSY